jgi:hypothetical protein
MRAHSCMNVGFKEANSAERAMVLAIHAIWVNITLDCATTGRVTDYGADGGGLRARLAACPYRKLDSRVAVMQTADHWLGSDPTIPLNRSADGRILG